MSDFRKSRGKKTTEQSRNSSEEEGGTSQESTIASPMIGTRSKIAGGIKKTERMSITLPVSGTEIELTSTDVVPSDCSIHPSNQRIQELLRVENPNVSRLMEAISRDKQREPVIARWIDIDGQKVLEVLDGSRRRFVCDLLHKDNPEILLRAWVGRIPDADAEYLSKFGNDDRDDISAWEKAKALKKVELTHPTWSHEVIAANERVSRQTVTNLLQIADIPFEVVSLLESPDLLKVNSGLQVAKLIREAKDTKYIKALSEDAPYKKFSDLANRIKTLLVVKKQIEHPSANKKIEIKKGKSVRAAIGVNRKTPGQYKVDLFDLSETEYTSVLEALEKILR